MSYTTERYAKAQRFLSQCLLWEKEREAIEVAFLRFLRRQLQRHEPCPMCSHGQGVSLCGIHQSGRGCGCGHDWPCKDAMAALDAVTEMGGPDGEAR